ncbi:hypothetical protein [Paenibacillus puerhi]|uniref:hypothetical protein n=1 Tax=Paenibacillus puerhi TaxID=2692622 RepID=UPI0013568B91|nr:hypothetical protein [Paenibacillus puerhi]
MSKPKARTVKPGEKSSVRRASLPRSAAKDKKPVVGLAPFPDGGDKEYTLIYESTATYNKPSFV